VLTLVIECSGPRDILSHSRGRYAIIWYLNTKEDIPDEEMMQPPKEVWDLRHEYLVKELVVKQVHWRARAWTLSQLASFLHLAMVYNGVPVVLEWAP
jgi:hypothetical protein